MVTSLCAVLATGLMSAPAHADETRDASWHLKYLRIAEAHKITQGEGVTVAVIDTGVDADHPDLRGAVLPGLNGLNLTDPAKGRVDTDPGGGHGTSMASLIAGRGHGDGDGVLGIAPKAKILPITVARVNNGGLLQIDPGIVGLAISKAVDMGADVINVSLGGSRSPRQNEAVRYAMQRGVPVLAASGNTVDGPFAGSPASVKEAFTVSSSDRKGNYSPSSVSGEYVDISAPGVDIPMARSGGSYYTGTGSSAATAIASGTMALIKAKFPNADWGELVDRLGWTTKDRDPPGWDDKTGWGVIDPVAALTTEPREPSKSASPSQTAVAEPATWEGGNTALDIVRSVALLVGVLVVLVGIGVFVVLFVRRRRRAGP